MKWSFKVAKVAGTEVRIHFTFFLLLIWIGVTAGAEAGFKEGLTSVIFVLLIFLCVLLHEFGHVAAALRYGITTPRITLLPFGGLASMSRIPRQPSHELAVALAGPAVNLVIAVILTLVRGGFPNWGASNVLSESFVMIDGLIWTNLFILVFNLIPAFPMDGGRVFRAALSFIIPREKATSIAAALGQTIGVIGGILALLGGQPILLLIAIFVFFAAGSEASMAETEHLLEGVNARDAAMSEFHSLAMTDTIQYAVDLMLNGSQADFPVVNSGGQCIGIATRNEIIRCLREEGPDHQIADTLKTIPSQVDEETSALDAWQKLMRSQLPAAAVVDDKGSLTRWLTRENLAELIMTRSAIDHSKWVRNGGAGKV